jgi:hypothetical protein
MKPGPEAATLPPVSSLQFHLFSRSQSEILLNQTCGLIG